MISRDEMIKFTKDPEKDNVYTACLSSVPWETVLLSSGRGDPIAPGMGSHFLEHYIHILMWEAGDTCHPFIDFPS